MYVETIQAIFFVIHKMTTMIYKMQSKRRNSQYEYSVHLKKPLSSQLHESFISFNCHFFKTSSHISKH